MNLEQLTLSLTESRRCFLQIMSLQVVNNFYGVSIVITITSRQQSTYTNQ